MQLLSSPAHRLTWPRPLGRRRTEARSPQCLPTGLNVTCSLSPWLEWWPAPGVGTRAERSSPSQWAMLPPGPRAPPAPGCAWPQGAWPGAWRFSQPSRVRLAPVGPSPPRSAAAGEERWKSSSFVRSVAAAERQRDDAMPLAGESQACIACLVPAPRGSFSHPPSRSPRLVHSPRWALSPARVGGCKDRS